MPRQFRAHPNLIALFAGPQLYSTPLAAVRELLQNAEDACSLQELEDPEYVARIIVRYSPSQNWVEVVDNGLGMNEETVEASFTYVGAPKGDVSHIRDLLSRHTEAQSRQIAAFGVGILSCFGVAQSITVRTKMTGSAGIAFRIPDFRSPFEDLADTPSERGTVIHLDLKLGGPMQPDQVPGAVAHFARHAAHVEIENADTGGHEVLPARWTGADLGSSTRLEDQALRDGYLALDPNWSNADQPLRSHLVVTNGGFLVRERETHLLPTEATGFTGEIDIRPGQLTILVSREDFQRDEKWQQLGQRLNVVYNKLLRAQLDGWERAVGENGAGIEKLGIDRAILVLTRGPTQGALDVDILARLQALLPRTIRVKLWGTDERVPIAQIAERSRDKQTVYYLREEQGPQQFQQAIEVAGGSAHVTETAQTLSLRATHLKLKGHTVVSCRLRGYQAEFGASVQTVQVHEADLLSQECQKAGLRWVAVHEASPEDVELKALKDSALLTNLLELGEQLKLVSVSEATDRVIRDYAGRLLNCTHPEIREILRILPAVVGNPVRRVLLQIYMDIDNYRNDTARQRIKELLTAPDLAEQAQLTTGPLLRAYLEEKLRAVVGD